MTQKIIALTGVSGVGKSTLMKSYDYANDLQYLSASKLIAHADIIQDNKQSGESLRNQNIDENQIKLIRGFWSQYDSNARCIILDGHAVIDSPDGLVYIEPKVFREISVTCIICLIDTPENIVQKRVADKGRSRPLRSIAQIHEYQSEALLHSNKIALELKIPSVSVPIGNVEIFKSLL